jgi:hypothetical protein
MRKFTREQGHTTKTPEIIDWKHEGYIEDQHEGHTARVPLDIIGRRLELLSFSGQVCKLWQGTRIFDDLKFDTTKLDS